MWISPPSKAWTSPFRRSLYTPPTGSASLSPSQAAWCSPSTLRAIPFSPIPLMRDCMPGKYSATSARDSPMASKL